MGLTNKYTSSHANIYLLSYFVLIENNIVLELVPHIDFSAS